MATKILLLLNVCLLAGGAFAFASRVTMEPDVSSAALGTAPNWIKIPSSSSSSENSPPLTFHIMLKHDENDLQTLEKLFDQVSDPKSREYGRHVTIDDLTALLAPGEAAVGRITAWLTNEGVDDIAINRNRDVITIRNVNRLTAEKLFDTEIAAFQHTASQGVVIHRAVSPYSLPADVAADVSVVEDLIRFPYLSTARVVASPDIEEGGDDEFESCGTSCSGFTTPDVLATAYNFPTDSAAVTNNSMAVAEFQGQYYDDADLTAFSTACGIDTVVVDTTVGGNTPSRCSIGVQSCVESLLDIEFIKAVAPEVPLSVFYSGTFSLADWATTIGDQDEAPLVNSVSYGNDEVQQTSTAYMRSVNTQFMKLGARGVSILFASGDQGVWGRSGTTTGTFNPDFPAGSPYVTAVGGTDFVTKSTIGAETAWNDGGGGFSDTFPIPEYQADAVASFKTNSGSGLPAQELWNNTGRGYPDVSALAGLVNPYCVAYGGSGDKFGGIGGTSAASPVVAAIFAKLNGVRLSAGGAPLGFLNPLIYQNPDCFNDVTSGTNDGGGAAGFTAIDGWDAATGFGSPNFSKLKAVI